MLITLTIIDHLSILLGESFDYGYYDGGIFGTLLNASLISSLLLLFVGCVYLLHFVCVGSASHSHSTGSTASEASADGGKYGALKLQHDSDSLSTTATVTVTATATAAKDESESEQVEDEGAHANKEHDDKDEKNSETKEVKSKQRKVAPEEKSGIKESGNAIDEPTSPAGKIVKTETPFKFGGTKGDAKTQSDMKSEGTKGGAEASKTKGSATVEKKAPEKAVAQQKSQPQQVESNTSTSASSATLMDSSGNFVKLILQLPPAPQKIGLCLQADLQNYRLPMLMSLTPESPVKSSIPPYLIQDYWIVAIKDNVHGETKITDVMSFQRELATRRQNTGTNRGIMMEFTFAKRVTLNTLPDQAFSSYLYPQSSTTMSTMPQMQTTTSYPQSSNSSRQQMMQMMGYNTSQTSQQMMHTGYSPHYNMWDQHNMMAMQQQQLAHQHQQQYQAFVDVVSTSVSKKRKNEKEPAGVGQQKKKATKTKKEKASPNTTNKAEATKPDTKPEAKPNNTTLVAKRETKPQANTKLG